MILIVGVRARVEWKEDARVGQMVRVQEAFCCIIVMGEAEATQECVGGGFWELTRRLCVHLKGKVDGGVGRNTAPTNFGYLRK